MDRASGLCSPDDFCRPRSQGGEPATAVAAMYLTRLTIDRLRSLRSVDIVPGPRLNVLVGDNGAGKTSVLEALHLLAYGRSFRGKVRDGLVRSGEAALEVFAEWRQADGRQRRVGLRHSGQSWEGRLDGASVAQLGDLCAALAIISFDPGSHALISGGAEHRRRFLDWGLFHVEHEFFGLWRRYSRALKQRNALLKTGAPAQQLEAWDLELVQAGEPLTRHRQLYLEALQVRVEATIGQFASGLGSAQLVFAPGWKQAEYGLGDALLLARDRDRSMGHTTVGPHRSDWRLELSSAPNGESLSRGQAKLAALACLLAQGHDLAARSGDWPVIVLDDLASELDARHRDRVLAALREAQVQLFVSGTQWDQPLLPDDAVFHVEQGLVRPLSPSDRV